MITLGNGQVIEVDKFDRIEQVKGTDAALGHHFFEDDAMRFFGSKVYEDLWPVPGVGVLFITSEQFINYSPYYHKDPRLYTVRLMTNQGRIEYVGEFQAYSTLRQARAAARQYANVTGCGKM